MKGTEGSKVIPKLKPEPQDHVVPEKILWFV